MEDILDTKGAYYLLSNYKPSCEFILENSDKIDKMILLDSKIKLSEKFIEEAISTEYLELDDINNINMLSYSEFSSEFLEKYKEYINIPRLILYLSASEIELSEANLEMVKSNNLWKLISANNLDIDFIREHKDNLDWNLLQMVNVFTKEEKLEFDEYITESYYNNLESMIDAISIDDISNMIEDAFTNEEK